MVDTDDTDDTDDITYDVVVNDEEQYSIWPADEDPPAGWRREGKRGTKAECLSHIDEVWTDLRPLSLRQYMAEHADDEPVETEPVVAEESSLVDRLCQGPHLVEASLRPDRTPAAFQQALDQGYVFVLFPSTNGGTELGVKLDPAASDWAGADFEAGTGEVRVVGELNLDFEPVRCHARIDLAGLSGEGWLERV